MTQLKTPRPAPRTYEQIKEAARQRAADASSSGRDIGDLPPVESPKRKKACKNDLKKFLETYFPQKFRMSWSADHLIAIEKIERAVTEGGLFALAMPRGTGKTSICERAAIWAVAYGHRKYVAVIGATETASCANLDEIKMEFECNDLLLADFPEICYPVRKLDGIANRCNGQTCNGKRTRITWTENEIVLPTIPDAESSGAVIQVRGITGRLRGMKAALASGESLRPDFVLIDDPQTDESAASLEQNKKRVRILSGAILGLGGPGVKMAGVMPCTVINPGDMADVILDREKHPEWNGERRKLLVEFPTNMDLWNRYAEIWAESFRVNGNISEATEFYRDHRSEMDAGAVVSWPDRYEPDELSGIQYAMDLFIRDKETFYAEYQNEPLPDDDGETDKISCQQIFDRMNNRPRGEVPLKANLVTMFCDVQKNLLYWMVCAWADDFTGWIIDYGAFPDQKKRNFSLKKANPTYSQRYPDAGFEGAVILALNDLCADLLARTWRREDGAEFKIERAYIDSGWGRSTDAVFQFCRESIYSAILLPSKGQGITAAQRPFSEYRRNQGDKIGFNWMIPNVRKKRSIRYILYDTNFWKSFFRERLVTSPGDPGSLTIYGNDIDHHRYLAEQLSSEYSEPTTGRGRKVDVWKMHVGRENHWLDCLIGNMVAANEKGGCTLPAHRITPRIQRTLTPLAQEPTQRQPRHFSAGRRFSANR